MRVQRNPIVEMVPMKNEAVLYSPDSNKFCILNASAMLIWEELAVPKTREELLVALLDNFNGVVEDSALTDIENILLNLRNVDCLLDVG
jgi:hypothetical protein